MLTAKLKNLTISSADLQSIHEDSRIAKHELSLERGSLWIANNGHADITEQYQMYAKGIIYHLHEGNFTLVSMPFVKFYNSFEPICIQDVENLDYTETRIVKKQDGTLISRFVWDGKVYFATRGNILVPGKQFYNPVLGLVREKYPTLEGVGNPDPEGVTCLFEYVGPSNVILEKYDADELVGIGVNYFSWNGTSWDIRSYTLRGLEFKNWGIKTTHTYNLASTPKEVLDSLSGVQEGVIVEYLDKYGAILYRVKFKQEAYIKALKSRSFVEKLDPIALLIEHNLDEDRVIKSVEESLEGNPFKEELVQAFVEHLRSYEVSRRVADLIFNAADLQTYAENKLTRYIADGMERKDIYKMICDSEYSTFRGVLMNMAYKYVPYSKILETIYKITG